MRSTAAPFTSNRGRTAEPTSSGQSQISSRQTVSHHPVQRSVHTNPPPVPLPSYTHAGYPQPATNAPYVTQQHAFAGYHPLPTATPAWHYPAHAPHVGQQRALSESVSPVMDYPHRPPNVSSETPAYPTNLPTGFPSTGGDATTLGKKPANPNLKKRIILPALEDEDVNRRHFRFIRDMTIDHMRTRALGLEYQGVPDDQNWAKRKYQTMLEDERLCHTLVMDRIYRIQYNRERFDPAFVALFRDFHLEDQYIAEKRDLEAKKRSPRKLPGGRRRDSDASSMVSSDSAPIRKVSELESSSESSTPSSSSSTPPRRRREKKKRRERMLRDESDSSSAVVTKRPRSRRTARSTRVIDSSTTTDATQSLSPRHISSDSDTGSEDTSEEESRGGRTRLNVLESTKVNSSRPRGGFLATSPRQRAPSGENALDLLGPEHSVLNPNQTSIFSKAQNKNDGKAEVVNDLI